MINVEINGTRKRISPEDVAAELLKKMKQYAEVDKSLVLQKKFIATFQDHFGGDEVQDAVMDEGAEIRSNHETSFPWMIFIV